MSERLTRTEMKLKAQEAIAHMVSSVFLYVREGGTLDEIPESQQEDFHEILEKQADRVARLLGYEKHWKS